MNKQDEKQIKVFLKGIEDVSETKIEIYWILPPLLFSRKVFRNKKDLEKFISTVLKMHFAEYVYRSRTILLGRVMKKIHNMSLEEVVKVNNRLTEFLMNAVTEEEKPNHSKTKDDGFFSDWESFLNKDTDN
ncbi:hypothetical protein [Bacillus manliponensis]|uniref:hypothetical protein n=1 Tax=Bacillus manliponensis TaxID=574376 RepID=UPI003511F90D